MFFRAFEEVWQQFVITNSADALRYMRRFMFSKAWGARPGVTQMGIFLTDGRSDDKKATLKEAKLLHLISDIQMIAIGNYYYYYCYYCSYYNYY